MTQKYQLENLLRRIKSFLPDNNVLEIIKDCEKGDSVLDMLDFKIKQSEVDWSNSWLRQYILKKKLKIILEQTLYCQSLKKHVLSK